MTIISASDLPSPPDAGQFSSTIKNEANGDQSITMVRDHAVPGYITEIDATKSNGQSATGNMTSLDDAGNEQKYQISRGADGVRHVTDKEGKIIPNEAEVLQKLDTEVAKAQAAHENHSPEVGGKDADHQGQVAANPPAAPDATQPAAKPTQESTAVPQQHSAETGVVGAANDKSPPVAGSLPPVQTAAAKPETAPVAQTQAPTATPPVQPQAESHAHHAHHAHGGHAQFRTHHSAQPTVAQTDPTANVADTLMGEEIRDGYFTPNPDRFAPKGGPSDVTERLNRESLEDAQAQGEKGQASPPPAQGTKVAQNGPVQRRPTPFNPGF
jgi:hypothetical protein